MSLKLLFLFPLTLGLLCECLLSQNANGIIDPVRAADWTQAGIPSGIPSGAWTQCGATIAPYTGNVTKITTQLAGCGGQNKYVLLGPGTFNLTGQIAFPTSGHVALRGSGANSTFIVLSGAATNCVQTNAFICGTSSDGTYTTQPPQTVYNWTSGFLQGTTQVTLSGTANITPNSTLLFLDQCDDGFAGASCTGAPKDNGALFICGALYNGTAGCSSNGPDDGGSRTNRTQLQITTASSIAGSVATLNNALAAPNWRSVQSPQVWIVQPISQVGVENLAIDMGTMGSALGAGVELGNAYKWWVSGCKFTNWYTWAINAFQTANGVVQNNYFYHTTGSDSYAVRLSVSSNELVQNNIMHQVFAPMVFDGSDTGNVVAYNFVNQVLYNSDYMRSSFGAHATNLYDLYEGNIATEGYSDGDHGIADFQTRFRNFFTGWESFVPAKDSSTNALNDQAFSRYENNVGNVLGTAGYHNAYLTTSSPSSNTAIYVTGSGNAGGSPSIPTDPLTLATSMFWGNYDVVTRAVRLCGNSANAGWTTTCSSKSEVPAGLSQYSNAVPTLGDTAKGQKAMPASFYLSSKPVWFGSNPWPPIGPDVSGGNIGQCSGGTYGMVHALSSSQCAGGTLAVALGGHANANPAMNCALNIMGMPPDGRGGVLAFDPNQCYVNSISPPPTPPTGLQVTVH